jgi:hypothetical protein
MLGITAIIFAILSIVCLILIFVTDDNSILKTVGIWGSGVCSLIALGFGLFWYKYKDQNQGYMEEQSGSNETIENADFDQ